MFVITVQSCGNNIHHTVYKMASVQRLSFNWLGACYMCSVDTRVLYMCSEATNDHNNQHSILEAKRSREAVEFP